MSARDLSKVPHTTESAPACPGASLDSCLDTRIVIGPNASMSVAMAWLAIGLAAAGAFTIAGMFALLGFWPILPFAGLEVLALAAALWVSLRRNRYREVVVLDGASVRVEFGVVGEGARATLALQRAWTRVVLEPALRRNHPTRLFLSCAGQSVEIGQCLTDDERRRLAERLRALAGSSWSSALVPKSGSQEQES